MSREVDLYDDRLTIQEIIGVVKTSEVNTTRTYVNTNESYNYVQSVYEIDKRYIDKLINHFKEEV